MTAINVRDFGKSRRKVEASHSASKGREKRRRFTKIGKFQSSIGHQDEKKKGSAQEGKGRAKISAERRSTTMPSAQWRSDAEPFAGKKKGTGCALRSWSKAEVSHL